MKRFLISTLCMVLILSLLVSCAKTGSESVLELLNMGEKYLLDGDYEQAVLQFLKVIDKDPKNPRGYTGTADAYLALGETDKVISVLMKGHEVLPNNVEIKGLLSEHKKLPLDPFQALLETGQGYLREKNFELALIKFLLMIESYPNHPNGYLGAAEAYIGLEEIEEAIAVLEQGHNQTSSNEIRTMLERITTTLPSHSETEYDKKTEIFVLVKEKLYDVYSGTSSLMSEAEHRYDDTGKRIRSDFSSYMGGQIYWAEYKYDNDGKLVLRRDHNDVNTHYSEDWLPSIGETEFVYDSEGRLSKEFFVYSEEGLSYESLSHEINYKYDVAGNLLEKIEINFDGTTTWTYTYEGNLLVQEANNWLRYVYEYDEVGRISSKKMFDIDNGLSSTDVYEYNEWNNLISIKTFDSRTGTDEYNRLEIFEYVLIEVSTVENN